MEDDRPLRSVTLAVVPLLFVVTAGCLPPEEDRAVEPEEAPGPLTVFVCPPDYPDPLCDGLDSRSDTGPREVEDFLDDSPEVVSYDFFTQEEAYKRVREIVDEEVGDQLTPLDLPPGYRVTVEDGDRLEALASALADMCGVLEAHYVEGEENPVRSDFPGTGEDC